MSNALITRREYFNLFRAETTGFLLGNAGDVMKCEIDFELEIKSISSTSNPFTLEQVGSQIRISRLTGSFLDDGFITGATMVIDYGGTTTCTIDYASSNMIIATYASTPPVDGMYPDATVPNGIISLYSASSVDGIELNYCLIKNSQLSANTLTSLIDGTTPTFKKSGVDCTVLTYIDIDQVGLLSGCSVLSAKIKGRGLSGSTQSFTIQLVYLITPIGTQDDYTNNVQPAEYFDTESITDNFLIKMLPQYNNPNVSISTDSSSIQLQGNVGWFGETLNGGATTYSVDKVELLNTLGLAISGIMTDGDTSFNITVYQPGNSPTSKYKFGFAFMPSDIAIFSANGLPNHRNLLYNGLDDTAAFDFTSAPGTYSGYTNAIGAQMNIEITSASATGDYVTLQGKFKPNADFKTYIEALPVADQKYIIWLSVADESLDTTNTDRVPLLLQFSSFVVVQTTFESYDIESSFLNHAQPRTQKGISIYNGASEDEVLANTVMSVDTSQGDIIEEVKFLIEGYNISNGNTYNLETRTYNTAGFPVLSGVQQIAVNDARGFVMAAGVEKNEIVIKRSAADDYGTKVGYRLYYPFRLRYEDWIKNLNVSSDFYNTSEQNNGLNNDWAHKDYFNNWRLYYAVQLKVNRAGQIINTKNRFQLLQSSYDESVICSGEITHYKADGTSSLFIGVNSDGIRENAIMPKENTWVKALFTLSDPMGDVGDIDKFYAVIRIEEYQGAGSTSLDMLSSVLDNETSVNKLVPLTGETKTKITKVSSTEILAECLIDYTKLDLTKTYKTSATIRCKGLHAGKYDTMYSLKYD